MLTFKNFLSEGEGLTNRRPGETFVDKDNSPITFVSVEFFPTKDDFEGDIDSVIFVNKPLSNLISLGVATFKNSDGDDLLFGKWVKPGTKAWQNSNPGFFEYKSKATAKEESGLKPTDFLTRMENLTPNDILKQVEMAFGKDSPLYLATQETIKEGYPKTPINLGEMSETGVTNYFAEILQPIALMSGNYTGNASDGLEVLAGDSDLTGFKINFPTGVTQGLYDSYLTSGDIQVNISSKFGSAAQSAKASVTNLYKIYKDYKDKDMFDEYEKEIEIMRIIAEENQEMAPVLIGVHLGLLKDSDKKIIQNLKKDPNTKLNSKIIGMRDSIKPGAGKEPDPYYHVIAGVAKSVCVYINETEDIQFSRVSSMLLNGTVIQVYTKAKAKSGVVNFSMFDTKWPDDAVTNVLIESGTRYKTNRVDGKLGYVIKSK